MEHKIKYLESELSRSKPLQFNSNKKELEKYRQLHLEELGNRMQLASQRNSANERLAEMNTELQMEKQHKSSFLGTVPTRPVDGPPSAENFNNSLEPKRIFSNPSASTGDYLFRMQKLENNIAEMSKKLLLNFTLNPTDFLLDLRTSQV